MAGNKTIGENYSFSGVHHIFDQHKSAGLIIIMFALDRSDSISTVSVCCLQCFDTVGWASGEASSL